MKNLYLLVSLLTLTSISASAQSVGINNNTPHSSAILDVQSNNKGMLIPRMASTQRLSIVNPAAGLMVFDSTEKTIYLYDGSRWLGFQPLTETQRPVSNLQFSPHNQDTLLYGYSVALWDQFAAVGAPAKEQGSIGYAGAVDVYKKNGNSWQHFSTLTPPGIVDTSYFGYSVGMCGNYLIVGAPNQKNGSNQRVGAVHFYTYNGTAWTFTQTVYGTTVGNEFGSSVDVNQYGTYAAVGERYATVSGLPYAGVVKIYNRPAATFTLQATLQDPSPGQSANFGEAMAMSPSGDYVLVGAPYKTVSGQSGNGYVGLFRRAGSSWSQYQTYTPVAEQYLHIGKFVDVSDTKAAFVVAKTKEVHDLTIPASGLWSGFTQPAYSDAIHGMAIDVASNEVYTWSGISLYKNGSGKVRSFSYDEANFGLPKLLSIYNKNYILGMPGQPSSVGVLAGAVAIGVSPN